MPAPIDRINLPLFVPADRPDRFAKAAVAGPDAVLVDLEDAVAPMARTSARANLTEALIAIDAPIFLRINAAGTEWFDADLAAAATLPLAAVVLAKAESADACAHVARKTEMPVIALIETARGVASLTEIASASARMAFGSIDYAADLGMGHTRNSLMAARSALVLAARVAGQPAPLDGVTTATRDDVLIEADCRHAVEMGLTGKLIIHPAQLAPARRGFAPSDDEVAWARRVVAAAIEANGSAAAQLGGAMIDAPVIIRAQQILARSELAA
ncbi:CoA ester lyase [Sulfitobacter sp. KE29]|uniref:HpcH/HpaI aldolase/citrate lyase family protein n=1 Tax=Sulfitobacter TaxID=60136 RepID=UPI0023E12D28|nr:MULTISPECIES: CoA ester lyase [Sulfitobacter]MDF3420122.1 CoA ester lyase [Sulfitobacter sp. Ks38]MDF3427607.1 CoA ester lyase [Sulfitobacter sp. KE29]MDF3431186.1 CoA ester lyase [Sulfitobacter sp. S46]MDF3445959.1 CoA ester lyase [Sulfitobacter sp. KE31]MDF3549968.1 CoA ester lyase [Sulfitobacter sp. KE28]